MKNISSKMCSRRRSNSVVARGELRSVRWSVDVFQRNDILKKAGSIVMILEVIVSAIFYGVLLAPVQVLISPDIAYTDTAPCLATGATTAKRMELELEAMSSTSGGEFTRQSLEPQQRSGCEPGYLNDENFLARDFTQKLEPIGVELLEHAISPVLFRAKE